MSFSKSEWVFGQRMSFLSLEYATYSNHSCENCWFSRTKRVDNFLACSARFTRGSQAECDFAMVINLSYRFGIRICLATSHRQIPKTPFSMKSSCILCFQAKRPPIRVLFILCLLYVGESQSISVANNSGLQTQQCPIGKVAGNPSRGRFNCWFARDVMAAMLVVKNKSISLLWELNSIFM